jgi:hypothetical protein
LFEYVIGPVRGCGRGVAILNEPIAAVPPQYAFSVSEFYKLLSSPQPGICSYGSRILWSASASSKDNHRDRDRHRKSQGCIGIDHVASSSRGAGQGRFGHRDLKESFSPEDRASDFDGPTGFRPDLDQPAAKRRWHHPPGIAPVEGLGDGNACLMGCGLSGALSYLFLAKCHESAQSNHAGARDHPLVAAEACA